MISTGLIASWFKLRGSLNMALLLKHDVLSLVQHFTQRMLCLLQHVPLFFLTQGFSVTFGGDGGGDATGT